MRKILLLSMACTSIGISGCDHYSEKLAAMQGNYGGSQSVADIAPAAGGEQTFSQILAGQYLELAQYENSKMYDFQAAKYYTEKAALLKGGKMVYPAMPEQFGKNIENAAEIQQARENLINALRTQNSAENRYNLAMAQSRFDCWVDQNEENSEDPSHNSCKPQFEQFMQALQPKDVGTLSFDVPFDNGSSMLSPQARASIDQVVAVWRNQGQRMNLSLSTAGDIDPALAEQQISAVRSVLQFNGVPATAIMVDDISSGAFKIELKNDMAQSAALNLPPMN